MKNINIGLAKLGILNKLNESGFDHNLIEESNDSFLNYMKVIRKSPILQLEFKIYSDIEDKHIKNDILIKEYIDKHIELFEIYSLKEIQAERAKLKPFISENIDDDSDKVKLYNAIDMLITESLKVGNEVDVDGAHEAFTLVFNHIKTPKKSSLTEDVDVETMDEQVIEIAVDKFNEKYSNLAEDDGELLKTLINATPKEKEDLLETYKTETLTILETVGDEDDKAKMVKAVQKIKEMVFNGKTVDDNIISLHGFKKELL